MSKKLEVIQTLRIAIGIVIEEELKDGTTEEDLCFVYSVQRYCDVVESIFRRPADPKLAPSRPELRKRDKYRPGDFDPNANNGRA